MIGGENLKTGMNLIWIFTLYIIPHTLMLHFFKHLKCILKVNHRTKYLIQMRTPINTDKFYVSLLYVLDSSVSD